MNLDASPHSPAMGALLRVAPFIVIIAVIGLRVGLGKTTKSDLGWQRPRSWPAAAGWWLLFVAVAAGLELFTWLCGKFELGGFNHTGMDAAIRIVGMVLIAPVAEELLFRGMFLNLLLRWLKNPHVAIAIQAVVFVAFHTLSWPITFAVGLGMAQRFIDASLFGYARRHTDSLFVPIAMHMTGNIVSVVEQLW